LAKSSSSWAISILFSLSEAFILSAQHWNTFKIFSNTAIDPLNTALSLFKMFKRFSGREEHIKGLSSQEAATAAFVSCLKQDISTNIAQIIGTSLSKIVARKEPQCGGKDSNETCCMNP
jgi:hypothetical protein